MNHFFGAKDKRGGVDYYQPSQLEKVWIKSSWFIYEDDKWITMNGSKGDGLLDCMEQIMLE